MTVSGPFQHCDLFRRVTIHFFGTVARSTIVHEYCAFMNVHVISQLFFEQFHIFFTIHGGTRVRKYR